MNNMNVPAICFTLADALLGIETRDMHHLHRFRSCFTLADALLGIETLGFWKIPPTQVVSLWLMPF